MLQLRKNTRLAVMTAVTGAVAEAANASSGNDEGKGIYFRLFYLPDGAQFFDLVPLISAWVGGSANYKKKQKYKLLAFEKAIRLARHLIRFSHRTSWESRNPEHGLYGGAAMLECQFEEVGPYRSQLLFSCSGLAESADEAAMLLASQRMKPWQVGNDQLRQILVRTKNPIASKLLRIPL